MRWQSPIQKYKWYDLGQDISIREEEGKGGRGSNSVKESIEEDWEPKRKKVWHLNTKKQNRKANGQTDSKGAEIQRLTP